jgi:hypothetical protein
MRGIRLASAAALCTMTTPALIDAFHDVSDALPALDEATAFANILTNPASSFVGVRLPPNYDGKIGPALEPEPLTLNIQSVIPINLSEGWNAGFPLSN